MSDREALTRESDLSFVGEAGYYMVFDGAGDDVGDVFSDGPGRWQVWPGGTVYGTRREAALAAARGFHSNEVETDG